MSDTTIFDQPLGPGPGDRIGGFEIKRLLGQGAMGEVYLAHQVSMGRDVALKMLRPELTSRRDMVDRFLNEVRMAARLEHSNIVTAFEAGEDEGKYYLAMAFVDGASLDEILRRDGPLPEGEALRIVRKLASALQLAWNEHRMLHRDIKPANVILDRRGEPKLTDFGLCKSFDERSDLTVPGTILGSPSYMSPEQVAGDELDTRADMYSLGATLYQMVTGKRPFAGSSIMETLRKQATEPLPDPRTVNPSISEPCVALLEKMLAKKPLHRHPTWEALLADLDRVAVGKAPRSAPLEPGESCVMTAPAMSAAAPPPPPAPPAPLRPETRTLFEKLLPAGLVVVTVMAVLQLVSAFIFGSGLLQGPRWQTFLIWILIFFAFYALAGGKGRARSGEPAPRGRKPVRVMALLVVAAVLLRFVPQVIVALRDLGAQVSNANQRRIDTMSLAALLPPVRINAGAATPHTSGSGVVWLPDHGFVGGEMAIPRDGLPITNTLDPEVYQTERYGMSYFAREVPNGQYVIYLHFAETFGEITAAGQRVFAINVEGTDIPAFDIIARAGAARTAYVEEVPVEITDGRLDITFAGRVQNAAINGIEIIPGH